MKYTLINPYIKKEPIKSTVKSSDDAARDLWLKLSSKIKDHTQEFYFSFSEAGSNKIHHYKVNEDVVENKVKFSIEKYKNIRNKKIIKNIKNLNTIENLDKSEEENSEESSQDGGKIKKRYSRRDSSSSSDNDNSSSSSSGDDLLYSIYAKQKYNLPISVKYNPNIYGVNNITLPSLTNRYSYSIGSDGLPTIYAPHSMGVGVHKLINQNWELKQIIKT